MQGSQDDEPALDLKLATQPSARSSSIKWKRDRKTREALEERIGPATAMGPTDMTAPDPQQISRLEWLDKVRRMYEFEKFGLKFQNLGFSYIVKGEEAYLDLIHGSDGSQLQTIFDKIPDMTEDMFEFKTRDLEEGEVLYQYEGVPTQLAEFIQIEDKVPVARPISSSPADVPTPSPSGTIGNPESPTAQTSKKANAFIKTYLGPAIAKGENSRDATAGPGKPDPRRHFGSQLSEVRKEHNQHNILNNKELRAWQSKVIVDCAGNSPLVEVEEKTDIEVETMLAGTKGEDDDDDEMDSKALATQLQLNAALSGSGPQLGPDVALSALVLGLSQGSNGLFRGKIINTTAALYPWQVSGVVYMLTASFGHVPTDGLPEEHLNKPEVQSTLESLERLPSHARRLHC